MQFVFKISANNTFWRLFRDLGFALLLGIRLPKGTGREYAESAYACKIHTKFVLAKHGKWMHSPPR